MTLRPVIWVAGPRRGGLGMWLFTWLALTVTGGRPVRVTPGSPLPDKPMHGLVISGGADVDPERYGAEKPAEEIRKARQEKRWGLGLLLYPFIYLVRRLFSIKHMPSDATDRDELETRLLTTAEERGVPVLGICRGAQLINVFYGGSLHQDLKGFYAETAQIRTVFPRKVVHLEEDSLLLSLTDDPRLRVNALHNQAVKDLGEGLRIVAREETGVTQAIEHTTRPFVLGVQWHPEFMFHFRVQYAIWLGLVRQARLYADKHDA